MMQKPVTLDHTIWEYSDILTSWFLFKLFQQYKSKEKEEFLLSLLEYLTFFIFFISWAYSHSEDLLLYHLSGGSLRIDRNQKTVTYTWPEIFTHGKYLKGLPWPSLPSLLTTSLQLCNQQSHCTRVLFNFSSFSSNAQIRNNS